MNRLTTVVTYTEKYVPINTIPYCRNIDLNEVSGLATSVALEPSFPSSSFLFGGLDVENVGYKGEEGECRLHGSEKREMPNVFGIV
jgi:hypothetical protein